MRSQGLPSSFLPAHLGINYSPPSLLVVLCDDFMPAGTSRRSGRSARHLVNPCSSRSRRKVACLSPLVSITISITIHLAPFTWFTEDNEFTAQTCYVWMLRASAERVDGALPSS